MAKIKQGILGGFSGKVANVVGTSWKGRAVMKSQPLSVANPRTTAQTAQRAKFSKISELASQVLTQFVQPVENPISGNISGYNLFCKDNKGAYSALGVLSASNLFAGGGSLEHNQVTTITADVALDKYELNWDMPASMPELRGEDLAYGLVVKQGAQGDEIFVGSATRADETMEVKPVNGSSYLSEGDTAICLIAFVSKDGRNVSVKASAVSKSVAEKD